MTEKEKQIYDAERKYREAKNERITKELDNRLKKLDSETETAKAHIKINKEKNKK